MKNEYAKAVISAVEKNKNLILQTLKYVWENPETGYKEEKTSKYLEDAFESLGYDLVRAKDIPGFYTVIDTGREGPEIMILGELDALICKNHPDADKNTGAVHSCGHCAQVSALVGIAAALKEENILNSLCGRIRLCAVPAEEFIEIQYREQLKNSGKIRYYGGKPEYLRRGFFDGVDLAFMVHTTIDKVFSVNVGEVGLITKKITYKGKSSHAGSSPWDGVNALYAATQGMSAVNALRETFKEKDLIRFHPIITEGGAVVNAIPNSVTIESYVRGSSFEAIADANKRINRALCGSALSIGANIEICDLPGCAPFINSLEIISAAKEALPSVIPNENLVETGIISSQSTDMGDLSCVMPIAHLYAPGATGTPHGDDYKIGNPELACIGSAKWQLAILGVLLSNGGVRAKEVISNYKPLFNSKKEYFDFLDSFVSNGDRIVYKDGFAEVKID